ncbi:unnamed protein product [Schistosoma curassoni]|uniref:Uncharacterized protein n=1 Tax=Schistosoma curassoni TaxID=6186 RepID=A0A183KNZ3_9TREM|nr:unnamed protein product [Schistosoma curassoni]
MEALSNAPWFLLIIELKSLPDTNYLRNEKSFQETLDSGFVLLGARQKDVPVFLRELVLPGGFDPVSPSFTVRDVTTELSEPRSTSCRTEM